MWFVAVKARFVRAVLAVVSWSVRSRSTRGLRTKKPPAEPGAAESREVVIRLRCSSVVVGGAAEKLFPGAFLVGRGGFGGAMEAALIEIDEPNLAGGADNEIA